MAGVDSNIYFQQQSPDFVGSVQKGMSLRDMIDQKQKAKNVDEAYKAGIIKNSDGTTSFDKNKTLSAMAGVGGKEFLEAKSQFASQDAAEQKAKMEKQLQSIDLVSRLAGSAVDQGSYDMAKQEAAKFGIDVSQMPQAYDAGLMRQYQMRALSAKEQLENQLKQQSQQFEQEKFGYSKEKDNRDEKYRYADLASRSADRKEARDERRFQSGIVRDEKLQALKTPYGIANTVDDAKQLKEAHESKLNFDSKLNEMIDLRKKYGTEYFDREAVSRGKQLSKDLLLEYKNMAKLGVLSKSDEDIINAIIPDDPLGHSLGAPGQDPILSNLIKFKADKDKDFQNRINTRTREGMDKSNSQKTEMTKVVNGQLYRKVEGGWLPAKN